MITPNLKTVFHSLFILFLLFVPISCEEEPDGGPVAPIPTERLATLSSTQSHVKDGEIVVLSVRFMELAEESYAAKLGDIDIELKRVDSRHLAFLVPLEISKEYYMLNADFAENSLTFFTTKTEDIADPEQYFSDFAGDYLVDINEIMDFHGLTSMPEELSNAKAEIESAMSQFADISPADQAIAAKFLANNRAAIDSVNAAVKNFYAEVRRKNPCDFDCIVINGAKLIGSVFIMAESIGVLAGTVVSIGGITISVGGVFGTVIVAEAVLSIIRGRKSIAIDAAKRALGFILTGEWMLSGKPLRLIYDVSSQSILNDAKNMYEIRDESPVTFSIRPIYRSLNEADKNSSNTLISTFVNKYLELRAMWDEEWIDKYDKLPEFTDTEGKATAEDLSQFRIELTNNSTFVSVSDLTGTPEEFQATFSTDEFTDQSFSFDLVYQDGELESRTSLDCILKVEINAWQGSMSMDQEIMIEDCPNSNCGTGGCQSGHRALFGSSWGSYADLSFTYNSIQATNNFRQRMTVGGNNRSVQDVCYTAPISPANLELGQSFTVAMNTYAPDRWGLPGHLQDITFTVDTNTGGYISGSWTGLIRVASGHCLEQCSGSWEAYGADALTFGCDLIPENP